VGPDRGAIERHAQRRGLALQEAARELLEQRERWIEAVNADPYRLGYEPSIWWVAWALIDFPWCQAGTRKALAQRLGVPEEQAWEEWKQRLRRKLGQYGEEYIQTIFGVGYRFARLRAPRPLVMPVPATYAIGA
jgi:hypothetical protein